jgi:hypothetical protein
VLGASASAQQIAASAGANRDQLLEKRKQGCRFSTSSFGEPAWLLSRGWRVMIAMWDAHGG